MILLVAMPLCTGVLAGGRAPQSSQPMIHGKSSPGAASAVPAAAGSVPKTATVAAPRPALKRWRRASPLGWRSMARTPPSWLLVTLLRHMRLARRILPELSLHQTAWSELAVRVHRAMPEPFGDLRQELGTEGGPVPEREAEVTETPRR